MNRAERRRLEKAKQKAAKPARYSFSYEELREQVDQTSKEYLDKYKAEIMTESINASLTLLFSLPMRLLKEYWPKTYSKRIPKFNAKLLDLFDQYRVAR